MKKLLIVGISALVVVTLLAGCSGSSTKAASQDSEGTSSTQESSTSTQIAAPTTLASPADDLGLTPTNYALCLGLANATIAYIKTGHPTAEYSSSQVEFDRNLAVTRAQILSAPESTRSGLIRASADDVISRCNEQQDAIVQQQREAAAKQQRQQQAAAADAATASRLQATCAAHGATIAGAGCYVNYEPYDPNTLPFWLPIDGYGNWDTAEETSNRSRCDAITSQAARDAAKGHPWKVLPEFHADNGVCAPGLQYGY